MRPPIIRISQSDEVNDRCLHLRVLAIDDTFKTGYIMGTIISYNSSHCFYRVLIDALYFGEENNPNYIHEPYAEGHYFRNELELI